MRKLAASVAVVAVVGAVAFFTVRLVSDTFFAEPKGSGGSAVTQDCPFMTDEEVGEWKATHDPAPPRPPSQELLDQIAAKDAIVKEWYAAHPDKVPAIEPAATPTPCAPEDGGPALPGG